MKKRLITAIMATIMLISIPIPVQANQPGALAAFRDFLSTTHTMHDWETWTWDVNNIGIAYLIDFDNNGTDELFLAIDRTTERYGPLWELIIVQYAGGTANTIYTSGNIGTGRTGGGWFEIATSHDGRSFLVITIDGMGARSRYYHALVDNKMTEVLTTDDARYVAGAPDFFVNGRETTQAVHANAAYNQLGIVTIQSQPPAADPDSLARLLAQINQDPGISATPTQNTIFVNGQNISFQAYNIGGNNFFRLRDIAYVLNGTSAQFAIGWHAATNAITLTTGQPYTPIGTELETTSPSGTTPVNATPSHATIYLNNTTITPRAYNIAGNNYFMLRDLAGLLNFTVDWHSETNSIHITTP